MHILLYTSISLCLDVAIQITQYYITCVYLFWYRISFEICMKIIVKRINHLTRFSLLKLILLISQYYFLFYVILPKCLFQFYNAKKMQTVLLLFPFIFEIPFFLMCTLRSVEQLTFDRVISFTKHKVSLTFCIIIFIFIK